MGKQPEKKGFRATFLFCCYFFLLSRRGQKLFWELSFSYFGPEAQKPLCSVRACSQCLSVRKWPELTTDRGLEWGWDEKAPERLKRVNPDLHRKIMHRVNLNPCKTPGQLQGSKSPSPEIPWKNLENSPPKYYFLSIFWVFFQGVREGANREKLTVKKLIDNEMFFF